MVTGTSRRHELRARWAIWPAAAALVALVALFAVAGAHHSAKPPVPPGFGWLRPAAASPGWHTATTPSGATLAYPPGWHTIRTDSGTVSAAPVGRRGAFAGYLNATPQSGSETLSNWSRFRVAHNADEGARGVRLSAAATGLRFRSGRGSCVVDSYSTVKTRFREIACIVTGARGTTVVVAAAPAARWADQAPLLERAVAAFTT